MSSRSKNEQLMLTALFKKTFADETFSFHTVWTGWYFGRYSAWTRLDHPHCRWVLFMVCVFGFTMIVASEPGGMNHDNYQIWYLHVHSVLWKDSPQKVRRFRFQVVFQLLSRAEQGQPYGELGALTVSHEKTRASLSWLKFANSGTVRTIFVNCVKDKEIVGISESHWIHLNPTSQLAPFLVPLFHFSNAGRLHCIGGHLGERPVPGLMRLQPGSVEELGQPKRHS